MSPASHLWKSFDLGLLKALHLRCTVRGRVSQTRKLWRLSHGSADSVHYRTTSLSLALLFSCISLNVKGVKDFSYCYLPEWLKVGIHRQSIQVTTWLSPFRMLFTESEISPGRGVPGGPSCLHLSARRRPTDAGASILSLVVSANGSRADPHWTDVRMRAENSTMSPGNGKLCSVRPVFVLIYSIRGAGQTSAALLPLSGGKQITMATTSLTLTVVQQPAAFLSTF